MFSLGTAQTWEFIGLPEFLTHLSLRPRLLGDAFDFRFINRWVVAVLIAILIALLVHAPNGWVFCYRFQLGVSCLSDPGERRSYLNFTMVWHKTYRCV